jgi:hypothetical protein
MLFCLMLSAHFGYNTHKLLSLTLTQAIANRPLMMHRLQLAVHINYNTRKLLLLIVAQYTALLTLRRL